MTIEKLSKKDINDALVNKAAFCSEKLADALYQTLNETSYPLAISQPEPLVRNSDGIVCALYSGDDLQMVSANDNGGVVELVTNSSVAPADEGNYGGESQTRVTKSQLLTSATVGILTPRSLSSDVTTYSPGKTAYDEAVGRTSNSNTGTVIRKSKPTTNSPTETALDFSDRNIYDLTSGKLVNFWVNSTSAKVSFYCASGETNTSDVSIVYNTTDHTSATSYNLASESADRYEIDFEKPAGGYVSIKNNTAFKCYVMGVNITPIQNADATENYDSFVAWYDNRDLDFLGVNTSSETGASDFAMRIKGGVTFGSRHGGHSNETYYISNGFEDVSSFADGEFSYGKTVTLVSSSNITDGNAFGTCTQATTFYPLAHKIETTVDLGENYIIDNLYTGMTVSNSRFSMLTSPYAYDMTRVAEWDYYNLGNANYATQVDPDTNHAIESSTTAFSFNLTSRDGAYVLARPNDYKFYYNSLSDADVESDGFSATTWHKYVI